MTRAIGQAGLPLNMLRTSTPAETWTNLALAGHEKVLGVLRRYLSARGAGAGRAMVLVGLAGDRRVVAATEVVVAEIAQAHAAVAAPALFGRQWEKNRFRTPYLRNALWDAGYAVDTLETAVPWSAVEPLAANLAPALRRGLADEGERVHAFMHLSHVYPTGSSLYTTYIWRLAPDPDLTLARWRRLKGLASAGDRRRRRDDQPPARRRDRPRPIPPGRKGRPRDGGAGGAGADLRPRRPHAPGRPPGGWGMTALTAGWRDEAWEALVRGKWDVLVVGGGITGAGIARRAAQAGLRTALVEQRDFAWGTSSRSSKLVHGGLRYLAHGQVGVVRQSVAGREALLRVAPGLVEDLVFLMPLYAGAKPGRLMLSAGLLAYDLLAGRRTHRHLSRAEVLATVPSLRADGLSGGFSYGDARTDDVRLVLRVLADARRAGAVTLSYARVEETLRDAGGVIGGRCGTPGPTGRGGRPRSGRRSSSTPPGPRPTCFAATSEAAREFGRSADRTSSFRPSASRSRRRWAAATRPTDGPSSPIPGRA